MRKCPKPLINTFAWAIWLKHLALRHIWLLYYKGSVLSIGFVSFFQLFSLLPRFFVLHQKKHESVIPQTVIETDGFSFSLSVKEFYSHQCQSLCRSSRAGHFAVAGFQNCLYSLRRILSVSYFNQSSGDNSYHVVEESCSCYTYGYDISVTPYIDSRYCTDSCFYLRFCTAEGCKIMLSDQV